jgi:hypothetical protein
MTTPTGSLLVMAFERAWEAIQERNPEVPDVVFITGGGLVATTGGIGVKWGHFGAEHWDTAEGGKAHELFISGEALTREPHETMCTLLHEAAHALNHERGENGTSRRGAYHNKTFVAAATELGLEWVDGKAPCKTRGFSEVTITEATREEYADTIAQLKADTIAWRDLMGLTFGGGSDGGDDDGDAPGGDGGRVAGKTAKPRSKNTKPKWLCKCDDAEDTAIWAARRTMERKQIICGECREPYEIHPDHA